MINTKASVKELNKLSTKIVYGPSMPRGRIYDRNYNIIVDNVGVNLITYKRQDNITDKDEVDLAYTLADNINVSQDKLNDNMLKTFWIVNNKQKANNKITKKEYELYERRKLKASIIDSLKIKRVTLKEISKYNDRDKKAAYIYYLMNNGYSYDEKIIKEEATDEEYAFVAQNKNNLKGVNISTSWKRVYPYGDVLREILGNVSSSEQGIPEDLKAMYLKKGYSLKDRVGISYLELQYDDELKGTKDKYEIRNGNKVLIKRGTKGNDIVLSIDINVQKALEDIIKEELIKAKKESNTKYFNTTSVVISDPNTGGILAMASKEVLNDNGNYNVRDYTTSLLTTSNAPGSIVKGASMLVGYSTGNLKIGDVMYDKCIKLKNTKEKCSWTNGLGALNDITALRYSSNSYQFQLALKVAGAAYYYNMPLKVDEATFDKYRNVFQSLGLGVKSGIDMPIETQGYRGKTINAGLLLNYAIGQYDTYSTLQLNSYINSIINNGDRLKLNIVKEIRYSTKDNSLGKIKSKYEKKILNSTPIDKIYFNRVKEGFASVMSGPLGRGYMGNSPDPAGKTGTSETFYDSDNDGVIDTETYTKSFIGYAPKDNPIMSIATISPHTAVKNGNNSYISSANKRITARICNKFFEIYK